jgi:hypothetical protein
MDMTQAHAGHCTSKTISNHPLAKPSNNTLLPQYPAPARPPRVIHTINQPLTSPLGVRTMVHTSAAATRLTGVVGVISGGKLR